MLQRVRRSGPLVPRPPTAAERQRERRGQCEQGLCAQAEAVSVRARRGADRRSPHAPMLPREERCERAVSRGSPPRSHVRTRAPRDERGEDDVPPRRRRSDRQVFVAEVLSALKNRLRPYRTSCRSCSRGSPRGSPDADQASGEVLRRPSRSAPSGLQVALPKSSAPRSETCTSARVRGGATERKAASREGSRSRARAGALYTVRRRRSTRVNAHVLGKSEQLAAVCTHTRHGLDADAPLGAN